MNILVKKSKKVNKIIFLALISLGVLFLIFALKTHPQTISPVKVVHPNIEQIAESSPSSTEKPLIKIQPVKTFAPSPTLNPRSVPTSSPTPQQNSSSEPISIPNFEVNVSVNGATSFTVLVNEESTQCDVLSKALEQNKITQLNMRYNSNLESNAVYQINGVGKENSVWWVYKVNGVSPSKGCSFVKANSGDNISWEYKGS